MIAAVLVLGGCSKHKEQSALRSVEVVEIEEERTGYVRLSVNVVAELIEARRSPAIFFHKDRLVIVGGCNKEGSHSGSAEILIRKGGKWASSLVRHFCLERSCSAFCEITPNLGVILGGWNGIDCLSNVQLVHMDNEVKSKGCLPDISFPLKNSFALAVHEITRSILLFGGWDSKQTLKCVFRLTFDMSFSSYEIVMEAILPYPVEGHSCALLGDTVFIIGGYDGVSVLDSITHYSISSKQSQVISTKLHIARENHVCEIVLDRYLLVMAGWNGYESLDSIEIFQVVDSDPFLVKLPYEFNLYEARNRPVSVRIS